MARKKKELPKIEKLEVESLAAEGKALAHVDGKVVFIPFAAPGDICDVQVHKKKKNFMEARITELHKESSLREDPSCDHFGFCGGCKWQHVRYEEQLKAKEQHVRDAMERIGKVPVKEYLPILGAEEIYHYRNKLEFTFSHKKWLLPGEFTPDSEEWNDPVHRAGLGFHIPGMFDKVLNIDSCHLAQNIVDDIRLFIRDFCLSSIDDYPFFDLRGQDGLMRTLMIRTTSTNELMLVLSFYRNDEEAIERLMSALKREFPMITSLLYVINEKRNDTIGDQDIICYSGQAYIEEEMEGLKFRIGPKSFYQTNSIQAYNLYKVVREFAGLTGEEFVYDLYTGTGTIANFVAKAAKSVIGIEYVPEAIEDAWVNSEVNGIDNTLFYAGDMKDILVPSFLDEHGLPDVIITDPPRAGMHPDVITTILKASPKRIVYVSCNPATQARDLAMLIEDGTYSIIKSRAVDMFPHTHHVENVVLLEK